MNEIKQIEIFGDKYKIRKTFDIIDYSDGIAGYEVCNENEKFILQHDCKKLSDLIVFLKWKIYKTYESTYS